MDLSSLPKEQIGFFIKTYKDSFGRKTPCKYPECPVKSSQNNHVFSKSVLKNINNHENNAIYLNFGLSKNSFVFNFLEAGWNQIAKLPISMRTLCGPHDHRIFRALDSHENVDLSLEENVRYGAYKAALHDIYKAESWLRICEAVKNSNYDELKAILDLDFKIITNTFKIKRTESILSHLIEFNDPLSIIFDHQDYVFQDKIEFYMCLFTRVASRSRYEKLQNLLKYEDGKNIFINFVPQQDSSILSIGAFGSFDQSIESVEIFLEELNANVGFLNDDMKMLKYTSDLALMRSDTWCFSHKFYEEKIKPREKEVLEIKYYYTSVENQNKPVGDFCLFW